MGDVSAYARDGLPGVKDPGQSGRPEPREATDTGARGEADPRAMMDNYLRTRQIPESVPVYGSSTEDFRGFDVCGEQPAAVEVPQDLPTSRTPIVGKIEFANRTVHAAEVHHLVAAKPLSGNINSHDMLRDSETDALILRAVVFLLAQNRSPQCAELLAELAARMICTPPRKC